MSKTVFTNGCFDILHPGHIELFKVGKSLGDTLIVAIDSDEKVRKAKGESRPINNIPVSYTHLTLPTTERV